MAESCEVEEEQGVLTSGLELVDVQCADGHPIVNSSEYISFSIFEFATSIYEYA